MMTVIHLRQWTGLVWIAFVAVWLVGALTTKRNVQRQSAASRLSQIAIVGIGAYLIFATDTPLPWFDTSLFQVTGAIALAGFAATLSGLGFSIWARLALGGNWSGSVTLKEHHTLVRNGPYRIVRHPIYTGLLLALIGAFLERGQARGIIGVAICGTGFWLKTLTEERFMVQRFGEEYRQYQHEVKALAPFIF